MGECPQGVGNIEEIRLYPLGDAAVVVNFGTRIDMETHRKVGAFASLLEKHPFPGMVEYVPAFTTVTVYYDVFRTYRHCRPVSPYAAVCGYLQQLLRNVGDKAGAEATIVEIPVCYGEEFGPDLEEVARFTGLSAERVIEIHSGADYVVYMIGFAPGFPYLGGLPEEIAAPRRATPRLRIPAGSVGIAGRQTGIYPLATPGGWQLIGRTPVRLFHPGKNPPTLLKAGDIVKFVPISRSEYERWKQKE